MPSCLNIPSIPNVRDSSGTIGTTRLPKSLSLTSVPRIRTKAIVVEKVRSPELLRSESNTESVGALSVSPFILLVGR